jgi:3'(2'), 5'-bisphosphate nucleotidase
LAEALPGDPIVGEEDAGALRRDEQSELRRSVVEHVSRELSERVTAEQVLEWIDHGNAEAAGRRYWTLDPIDGTKGFLRGEQYAVALALIEDGEVVLGVLGCPNLSGPEAAPGALFGARLGARARMYSLWNPADDGGVEVAVAETRSPMEARFCESVESAHSNQDESAAIALALGIRSEPYRIDSQCKYAAVARGDASIYLRMPTREDYRENIWDHAAGMRVVEAAGGRVTDILGNPLDFRQGKRLERNRGIVATNGAVHDAVIEAIERVRESSEKGAPA